MFEHRPKLIAPCGLMLAGCLVLLAGCGGADSTSAPNISPASVPAPPSNLAAAAGNAVVALTWTASSGAASYNVKRSTTSGGPYTQIAAPTSTGYTDSSLTNGTAYYYVVSALDTAGESANSAQASATPEAPSVLPAAPTNLTATAGDAQVSLTWSASGGATSYNVKRSTTSGGPYTQIAAPTSTSYTDTSLTNGTTYYYVVSAVNSAGESANSAQAAANPMALVSANVTVTVTPSSTHLISPYIYGVNNASNSFPVGTASALPSNLTFDRIGGNRLTAYNWETNASNAGADYMYENDGLFPGSVPASGETNVITFDQSQSMATVMTFQLEGLVAGDEAGPVSTANPPDLTRFKTVVDAKGSAFTTSPVTTDANVYMDEFAYTVDQRFAGEGIFSSSPTTHPVFASLDNEPDLWSSTHLELGSTEPTPSALITKTIALATALKNEFPNIKIFGPVNWGFLGVYSFQNGLAGVTNTGNNWFVDIYAQGIAAASANYGKPLVDVYDFHWYSQIADPSNSNAQITSLNGATLTDAEVQAIVQAPRSLYDPTFVENSWIEDIGIGALDMIPRLQAKLATENPGMQLAITEYYPGGGGHIAGTIAEADLLGAFGSTGLFASNMWPLTTTEPYVTAGFRAFRDFDGAGSNFGDTSVAADSSAIANVSAYVSTDSTRPGRVVIVAINRSNTTQTTAISGQPLSGTAHLFQMTAATASTQSTVQPVASSTQAVSGSSLTLTLPSLSVTTIDIY